MKTKKIIFYVLMFLPLIITAIALPFLPDQTPAHYDFNNQVTRWGSKYEALLFPVCTIFFGLFMLAMTKYSAKQEENGNNNENVCIIAGIVCLFLFNVMTGYSLYADFEQVENLSSIAVDLYQIVFGILGVSMVIIGNFMPKVRMNSVMGLRTRWSMKNETTWKKSQRFGGISFIAGGIVLVIFCILTKGFACLLWAMGTLIVLAMVDVYYTYRIFYFVAASQTEIKETVDTEGVDRVHK